MDLSPVGEAVPAGEIELPRARVFVDGLAHAPLQVASAVQNRVLPGAGTRTRRQVASDVARALITTDPGGVAERALGTVTSTTPARTTEAAGPPRTAWSHSARSSMP